MITKEELQGSWNGIKGKLKERWGQITDNEWREASGNVDQLVGLIQRKTGEARTQIEGFIDRLVNHSSTDQITDEAAAYTAQATAAIQDFKERLSETMQEQLSQAEDLVRRRPTESLLAALGTGLVVGVVIGCLSRSR
ncbi:MAG: CsbD family protein [Pirellulales bacterium]